MRRTGNEGCQSGKKEQSDRGCHNPIFRDDGKLHPPSFNQICDESCKGSSLFILDIDRHMEVRVESSILTAKTLLLTSCERKLQLCFQMELQSKRRDRSFHMHHVCFKLLIVLGAHTCNIICTLSAFTWPAADATNLALCWKTNDSSSGEDPPNHFLHLGNSVVVWWWSYELMGVLYDL